MDFISLPVITGFTAAASINIASSQFKSLLGIAGRSEDLVDSLVSVFSNLNSIRYQDTLLGIATIVALVFLKVNFYNDRRLGISVQCRCSGTVLGRNYNDSLSFLLLNFHIDFYLRIYLDVGLVAGHRKSLGSVPWRVTHWWSS